MFCFSDFSARLSIDLFDLVSDPVVMWQSYHWFTVDCHFNGVKRPTGPESHYNGCRNTCLRASRLLGHSGWFVLNTQSGRWINFSLRPGAIALITAEDN